MALGVLFNGECAVMGCKFICVIFSLVLLFLCTIINCGGK